MNGKNRGVKQAGRKRGGGFALLRLLPMLKGLKGQSMLGSLFGQKGNFLDPFLGGSDKKEDNEIEQLTRQMNKMMMQLARMKMKEKIRRMRRRHRFRKPRYSRSKMRRWRMNRGGRYRRSRARMLPY